MLSLAATAPYFHNGAAATLDELIHFYDENFSADFHPWEKRALVAFLGSI